MTNLPEKAITEFQQLYRARYGQDISVEEARRRAENLMKLYRVTYPTGIRRFSRSPKVS